ncbi:glyoxalase [Blastococcus sp. TF02-8]|uniref:glyoxalase superfamily protein n=1 Tax=Blastococcus sp. TF02-8 TaxID=2250574 RepID=UPI000DEAC42F|nr:glyoxalase superfamily protein [Blastococcus sp. TF02-8]RBY93369.1 glyoxalase [Blastococcus sp. TF02-8]
MTTSQASATTLTQLATAMFTVRDQDAALAFYVDVLGFEVRGDQRFGENGEHRWLEVAPRGSAARLALNPPMGDTPGGSAIGVESSDVLAEHARLAARGDVEVGPTPTRMPGAPLLFSVADPDGNHVWIVEAAPAG